MVGDAKPPLARNRFARFEGCHRIVTRQGRGIAIGIGQEGFLLVSAQEKIGAAAMSHAPLCAAFDPCAFVNERHRAISLESNGH